MSYMPSAAAPSIDASNAGGLMIEPSERGWVIVCRSNRRQSEHRFVSKHAAIVEALRLQYGSVTDPLADTEYDSLACPWRQACEHRVE